MKKFDVPQDTFWVTQRGHRLSVSDLEDNHLKNILKVVENKRNFDNSPLPSIYPYLVRELLNRDLFDDTHENILIKLAMLDLYVEDEYLRQVHEYTFSPFSNGSLAQDMLDDCLSSIDRDDFYDTELILYFELLHEKYEKEV